MCLNLPSLPCPPRPPHSGIDQCWTHSRYPGDTSWLNGDICFTRMYIWSPSIPGKTLLANFCLSGWHWCSCTYSFKRIICPLIWRLHQKEDCWLDPMPSFFMKSSLNLRAADLLILQILTNSVPGPAVKTRPGRLSSFSSWSWWCLSISVEILSVFASLVIHKITWNNWVVKKT